jgi:hypothetical protein
VETTLAGLVYAGRNPDHVRELVEAKRVWYDCAGARHVLIIRDFSILRALPVCWFALAPPTHQPLQGIAEGSTNCTVGCLKGIVQVECGWLDSLAPLFWPPAALAQHCLDLGHSPLFSFISHIVMPSLSTTGWSITRP